MAPRTLPPVGASQIKNYITPRGYKRLRDEHHYLRVVERASVVEEVSAAAAMGDRSENAEYIYGKKRLREIDRRLRWLHKRLAAAELVDPAIPRGDKVYFGATVTVAWPDGTERTFELVGEDEIEVDRGRISWRSPLGSLLMRKSEGDTVLFAVQGAAPVSLDLMEVVYRAQEEDPPSRWDGHVQRMAKAGAVVAAPIELAPPEDAADDDEDDA